MNKLVFMGTPEFAVPSLKKLIDTQQVIGVVTQPDRPAGRGRRLQQPPVKKVAVANGIPVYQPKSLRGEKSVEPLRRWSPDLIVVAAYGQILRSHVLEIPEKGCLNVHASLLPRWRGAAPIQHAILAGDPETGVSLMQMDPGMDTGPVYARRAIPIRAGETAASLHDRLATLGAVMLGDYLPAIVNGDLLAEPQDNGQATYAPMIKKQDGAIDWERSAVYLDRHIRAMTPWPAAFTSWQGQNFKILAASVVASENLDRQSPDAKPGSVLASGDGAIVQTGDGCLILEQVQLAGKRTTPIEEFLRGRPEFIGSQLGT